MSCWQMRLRYFLLGNRTAKNPLAAFNRVSRSSRSRKIRPAIHRVSQMPLDGYPVNEPDAWRVDCATPVRRSPRPEKRSGAATGSVMCVYTALLSTADHV
jgi:hypothetical protein